MAPPGAPPSTGTDPDAALDRRLRPRFPGLADSVPLLLFGGLAIVLGAYLVATHAPPLVGRWPLWAYLWTLGAIAIIGGLAASVVGQDLDGLPGEGEEVGDDLIVVRRSQWEELQEATAEAAPAPPEPLETSPPSFVTPPIPVERPRVPATAPSGVPRASHRTDWWDEALQLLDQRTPAPPTPRRGSEADEVLETLAAIERDAVPRHKVRPPSTLSVRASAPTSPNIGVSRREIRTPRPVFEEDEAPSIDGQLDAIDRELDAILAPSRPPPGERERAVATCVGCHHRLEAGDPGRLCESCNRPMCRDCTTRSRRSHRPGLCPTCSTLLDGALGESE